MRAPQILPMQAPSFQFVKFLLQKHIQNPDACYTLVVNKSPAPFAHRVSFIDPFEQFEKMFEADEDSVMCVDVTFHKSQQARGGIRYIITDATNDEDFNPYELGGFPQYNLTGNKQREQEIYERASLKIMNDSLKSENSTLKESVVNLTAQLKKAEEFSNEVERLIVDLKGKSQEKGTIDQIGDFIGKVAAYAPGLLKDTPLEGMAKQTEAIPAQNLSATTAVPKTEVKPVQNPSPEFDADTLSLAKTMKELKPFFSEIEFRDCFKLLGLIAHYKPLIGELYDLALSEVKRQVAIRKRAADFHKEQPQSQQQKPQAGIDALSDDPLNGLDNN